MLNPEFSKNLWLEITPHRLLATPVVMALVIVLVFVAVEDFSRLGPVFDRVLYFAAFGFLCVGGAHSTVQSMVNEFAGNTWDQQRMSPLSPWALTWGKIFGGASFMWYGGLWLVGLFFLVPLFLDAAWPLLLRIKLLVLLLGLALLCQAGCLLVVMSLVNAQDRLLRFRRNYGVAAVIVTTLVGLNLLAGVVTDGGIGERQFWWGRYFVPVDFWALSSVGFAGWAVWGAYQMMRQQMQFLNGQLSWVLFNLFLMGYVAGFPLFEGFGFEPLQRGLVVAYVVALALVYVMLLAEPLGSGELQHLVNAVYRRRGRDVWMLLPAWGISLLLVLGITLVYGVCGFEPRRGFAGSPMLVSVLLFSGRDAALLLWFLMGGKPQRAVTTMVVYLAVLYFVAPSILDFLGLEVLLGVFWPSYEGEVFIVPVLVEVLVMAALVKKRSAEVFRQPGGGG